MELVVRRSRKLLRQRFYYVLVHPNGQTLMTSEMYRARTSAVETAKHIAAEGGFAFTDET